MPQLKDGGDSEVVRDATLGALLDAEAMLLGARRACVGSVAVWSFLDHAACRASDAVRDYLRGAREAEGVVRGPAPMTRADADAWAEAGRREVERANARAQAERWAAARGPLPAARAALVAAVKAEIARANNWAKWEGAPVVEEPAPLAFHTEDGAPCDAAGRPVTLTELDCRITGLRFEGEE